MEAKKENGFGIAAMVLGIIGLVTSCIIIGVVPSILGFIFSLIALCKKNSKQGTSIAGLVCSIIGLIISGIMIILVVASDDDSSSKQTVQTQVIEQQTENGKIQEEAETTENQCEYNGLQVKYFKSEITKDLLGDKLLTVYYEFTNNSDNNESFDNAFSATCFQNGVELQRTYMGTDKEVDNYRKDIKPGTTLVVTTSFKMEDSMDDAEVEITPWLRDNVLMTVKIKLQ